MMAGLRKKAALTLLKLLTAVFLFSGAAMGLSFSSFAMAVSDEELEAAMEELMAQEEKMQSGAVQEYGLPTEDESLPEDAYDMDIEQFTEEYFRKLENGEIGPQTISTKRIIDPKLTMSQTDQGRIRYALPNGDSYEVTVPNGMITSSSVTFYPSTDVVGIITRDGEITSLFESWHFTEPGNYQVKLLFYHTEPDSTGQYLVYEVNHYFTITGTSAGAFGAVPAPDGFQIISVKRDGISQEIENPGCVFLEGDGFFEIRYRDTGTGRIYSSASFQRDTTAPFLSFSEDIGAGAVSGPLEFSPSEPGSKIIITYNGNTAEAVTNVLTVEGNYRLEVRDDAGNARVYQVQIQRDSHLLSGKLVILSLLLILAMGIRMIAARRDLRVL